MPECQVTNPLKAPTSEEAGKEQRLLDLTANEATLATLLPAWKGQCKRRFCGAQV